MYYEINVAKATAPCAKYRHFFATSDRSIRTERELREVYDALCVAFPSPDYILTVTRYEQVGHSIDMNYIKD